MSVKITSPVNGAEFQLGNIVEFKGTADGDIVRVTLVSPLGNKEFELNTVPDNDGSWSVSSPFNTGGERKIIAKGFDASENLVDSAEVKIRLVSYSELVAIPPNLN